MRVLINGIHLGYEILGENGPPLVLIHGFGLNRTIWMEMVRQYMGNQLVILPDLRGHGESDAPDGIYSMPLMAKDINGLMDELKIEKAVLCGHSMGGYVTLAFAEHYPERIAGLGLITSRAEIDSPEKKRGRYIFAEDVAKNGSAVLAESLAPRLSYYEKVVDSSRKIFLQTSPLGIIGASKGMAERVSRLHVLDRFKKPALIVAGQDDQIIPLEDARNMAGRLDDVDFLSIPHAGHMPMMETPCAFADALLGLVKRVESTSL